MAKGKFSQPRDRFQEHSPQDRAPEVKQPRFRDPYAEPPAPASRYRQEESAPQHWQEESAPQHWQEESAPQHWQEASATHHWQEASAPQHWQEESAPQHWQEAPDPAFDDEFYPEEDPETEAMDRAFSQVSQRSSFLDSLSGLFRNKNRKIILICVCAVVLTLIGAIIGILAAGNVADPYDGKILNNVTIAGIHVGGLTRSQAEDVIRSATENTFTRQDMVVFLPDTTLRFSPADTGAKLDVKAAVKAAYQYGRTGSQAQRKAAYEASLTGNHIIALLPYLELDREFIRSQIQTYADSFGSSYTPASFRLEGELPELNQELFDPEAPGQTLLITMGTPGLALDAEQLYEEILDAYSFNLFQVELREQTPSSIPAPPDLEAIYEACYIAPVNATMNQQTFEPIPGSYGYHFDRVAAQRLVDKAGYGETISIPMEYIDPEIGGDNLLFQDVLGYCETPYSNNPKRTHNLTLVCEYLNGLVLYPGEEFSYNERVGERSTARGFQAAPAYSGTKLVDSIGGGVCQGSSTLYYCALLADMEITDRINHGFPVSYIPMGMDATVSWYGPDFKFRNATNYPIQIKAETSDGYMRMWIMGTEERDYYIELEYEITRVITPDVIIEEHGPDSGYTDGQVLETGSNGYHVRTYKCRYDRETKELISRDFIVLSSYMTERRVVVKIVGEPTRPTEPPTTPPSGGDTGGDTGGSGGNTGGSGGDTGGSGGNTGGSGGDTGGSGGNTGGSGGDTGGSGGDTGGSGGNTGGSGGDTGGSGGGDTGGSGGGDTGGSGGGDTDGSGGGDTGGSGGGDTGGSGGGDTGSSGGGDTGGSGGGDTGGSGGEDT